MTEPTDAEIAACIDAAQVKCVHPDAETTIEIARAVLAKWGATSGAVEPVAWYVTGCGRLLDEEEAKAEARHIGGTARAIPLYTAPQADSVQDLQPVHDAVTIDLLNERVAYLERKLKEADSVLEDAARWQTFIALPYATRAEWASNLSLAPVLTQWVDAARKQGGA